jgi:putative SOS response-associated peptidase YedK
MCFSIKINTGAKNYIDKYKLQVNKFESVNLNYRAFPYQDYPVILKTDSTYELKIMNYSLIPSWSKIQKPKFATYNARVETIDEKPTWIKPLEMTRCLVPVTSFFESCYEGTHAGNIVEFYNEEIITLAGVYNTWINKETGEVIDSFAVVTKEPYPFVKKVGHDRSPICIEEEKISEWLNPNLNNIHNVKNFLMKQKSEPLLKVKTERALKIQK